MSKNMTATAIYRNEEGQSLSFNLMFAAKTPENKGKLARNLVAMLNRASNQNRFWATHEKGDVIRVGDVTLETLKPVSCVLHNTKIGFLGEWFSTGQVEDILARRLERALPLIKEQIKKHPDAGMSGGDA